LPGLNGKGGRTQKGKVTLGKVKKPRWHLPAKPYGITVKENKCRKRDKAAICAGLGGWSAGICSGVPAVRSSALGICTGGEGS